MFSYLLKFRDNITFGEVIPKRAIRLEICGLASVITGVSTHFGGVYFFREFLQVLQFRNFLAHQLTYPRRNRRYSLSPDDPATLVYPIVLGLDRLETASFLRSNGTFQYLTGLPSFPDPQTLRRFLHHAPDAFWQQMHRVNDRLLQTFIHIPDHRSRLIFDLDSTVVTVFGASRACRGRLQPPIIEANVS